MNKIFKILVLKILLTAWSVDAIASRPLQHKLPEELIKLWHLASDGMVNDPEFKLLKNYLSVCDDSSLDKTEKLQCSKILEITLLMLTRTQIENKEHVIQVMSYITAIKSKKIFENNQKLDKLIWYATVRLIDSTTQLSEFLHSQIDSNFVSDSLYMMGELGVEPINVNIIKESKFKPRQISVDIAKRRAELTNHFNDQEIEGFSGLEQEVIKSLSDALPYRKKSIDGARHHFNWLMRKLLNNKNHHDVRDTLRKIVEDEYFYIKDELQGFDIGKQEYIKLYVSEVLMLKVKAEEIMR